MRMSVTAARIGTLLAAAALVLSGCDSGPGAAGPVSVAPAALAWDEVGPDAPGGSLELVVANVGGGVANLVDVEVDSRESACGTFEVVGDPARALAAGQSATVAVAFVPKTGAAGGCGCVAIASLWLTFDAEPYSVEVPLVASGACKSPVRCLPSPLAFATTLEGETRNRTVTCWNVRTTDIPIDSAGLAAGGDGEFKAGAPTLGLPGPLAGLASFEIPVAFRPKGGGAFAATLEVRAESRTTAIPMTGTGEPRFPKCADGIPVDPEPVLETADYTVTLDTTIVSAYDGTIRSRWYYDNQSPLIADVLTTTGALADPACECGQSGHQAWWRNCDPAPEDLFINVHAFPMNGAVDTWVRRIRDFDRLQIRGWEVDRITYPNGSWWTDAGCHTLIITWICQN